jgi:hypothetical protein
MITVRLALMILFGRVRSAVSKMSWKTLAVIVLALSALVGYVGVKAHIADVRKDAYTRGAADMRKEIKDATRAVEQKARTAGDVVRRTPVGERMRDGTF